MALLIEKVPLPVPLIGWALVEQGRSAVQRVVTPGGPGQVEPEEVKIAVRQPERVLSESPLLFGEPLGPPELPAVSQGETRRDEGQARDHRRHDERDDGGVPPAPAPGLLNRAHWPRRDRLADQPPPQV